MKKYNVSVTGIAVAAASNRGGFRMRRVGSVAWKIVCQMDHVLFDLVPFENNLLKNNLFWIPKEWLSAAGARGLWQCGKTAFGLSGEGSRLRNSTLCKDRGVWGSAKQLTKVSCPFSAVALATASHRKCTAELYSGCAEGASEALRWHPTRRRSCVQWCTARRIYRLPPLPPTPPASDELM